MKTREFTPEALIDKINNNKDELNAIGMEDYLLEICKKVSQFTLNCLNIEGEKEDRDLTIEEIERMEKDIKGFSHWSVNVSCINLTFSPRYEGMPYNALTNRDPVIKRGLYWLTGVEPYDAVVDQLSEYYKPYSGVLTRYIWEAFNYERIPVERPANYRKWWNKGKIVSLPVQEDVVKLSKLDEYLRKIADSRS
jgi:hypothetical protein